MTQLISLQSGPFELTLAPSVGGSIARFDWIDGDSRTPILRPFDDGPPSALEMGCFPLIPFVNRVRDGRFRFQGREINLSPNMAGDLSPLHGQGWLSSWVVAESSESSAALAFRHWSDEWPWDYEGRQHFTLDETGLAVVLACRNLSDRPMPCGLGQHPYFPCGPRSRIDTQVTHVWTIDERVLPVEKVPATGRFDLNDRPVCGQDLDHGFGGWGGRTVLSDPDWPFDIAMASPTARFFQLYSPAAGGVCVAEPVTHANAALNAPEEDWPDLGMEVLEPGQEMSLEMRLEVTAKA